MASRLAERVVDGIQILTGLALLIGLVLVVWELRQTRSISVAQLTSEGYGQAMQLEIAGLGEEPHKTYTKACAHPEELTLEDYRILDSYFRVLMQQAIRAYFISVRTGFYSDVWEGIATGSAATIVSTAAGRIWWRDSRPGFPPQIRDLGDQQLRVAQSTTPGCSLDDWRMQVLRELPRTSTEDDESPE